MKPPEDITDRSAKSCIELVRLLHAVDCFPQTGLYSGYFALQAALRYETIWMKMQATVRDCRWGNYYPPLDVAFAWWAHRQDPAAHIADCKALYGKCVHPSPTQAWAFGTNSRKEAGAWSAASGKGALWPPAMPGSPHDLTARYGKGGGAAPPVVAPRLVLTMQRLGGLLHSWLRPHYLDPDFLERARVRYARFLSLHAAHPSAPLVPTADIALLWHTHLGHSEAYAARSSALFGTPPEQPWGPDYLAMSPQQLAEGYGEAARLYETTYGEPYDGPDTAWVSLGVHHPLCAPAGPLAHALSRYDAPHPKHAEGLAAAKAASWAMGVRGLDWGGPGAGCVPRSGAHAMLMAWTVAKAVEDARTATWCGCLPYSVRGRRRLAARLAARDLASLRYFHRLPSSHVHPYLSAIRPRKGLWVPQAQGQAQGQQQGEKGAREQQPVEGVVVGTAVPMVDNATYQRHSAKMGRASPQAHGDGPRTSPRSRSDAPGALSHPTAFSYLGSTDHRSYYGHSTPWVPYAPFLVYPGAGYGVEHYHPDLGGAGAALAGDPAAAAAAGALDPDSMDVAGLVADSGFVTVMDGGYDTIADHADAAGGGAWLGASFTGVGGDWGDVGGGTGGWGMSGGDGGWGGGWGGDGGGGGCGGGGCGGGGG